MPDAPLPTGVFDDLARTLAAAGPAAAADQLVDTLRLAGSYDALFYALLLRARHRMGADPIPSRPANELPEPLHGPYEEAIREAARTVGRLYLDAGDIPRAWNYYRLIGEPAPVREALDAVALGEDDDFSRSSRSPCTTAFTPRKGSTWSSTDKASATRSRCSAGSRRPWPRTCGRTAPAGSSNRSTTRSANGCGTRCSNTPGPTHRPTRRCRTCSPAATGCSATTLT
jgi:hypothetical protein